MVVYLSARFDRRLEMRDIAKHIWLAQFYKVRGSINVIAPSDLYEDPKARAAFAGDIIVNSRWLDEEPYPKCPIAQKLFLRDRAYMDKADVQACDVLARFSDDLSTVAVPSGWCTCARMEETGMAEAWGKTIVVIGGRQSVFDNIPARIQLDNTLELYDFLGVAHPGEV